MDVQLSEKKKILPTVDAEVPFSFEELFFSRTDGRGVILSGNSVFQRISHYSWDELLDKPHSLIRHPDMPRAVFWLLWETIKKGEPIGAYVKNRAKDGRYYWVFAIVTPVDDGYLSVRLKPSALLPLVAEEYRGLLALSTAGKLSPEASAGVLLKRLGELGFANYSAFMATALAKELATRDAELGRPADRMLASFEDLVGAAKSLLDQSGKIFAVYDTAKYVPLNLKIHAAQLGSQGVTIAVISDNYGIISGEIREHMAHFVSSAEGVLKSIYDGLFLICVAKVQHEAAEFFHHEKADGGGAGEEANEREAALLERQQRAYQEKAAAGLRRIVEETQRFQQDCSEMKRLATALEVTRIMGKMECSRLLAVKGGLHQLIDDLATFQTAVSEALKDIERENRTIERYSGRMLSMIGRAIPRTVETEEAPSAEEPPAEAERAAA
ncbi:MAG: PAS domain-containing protein [Bauldia sp.]